MGYALIDARDTVNFSRECSIHVRSVSDGIDPATQTGRLMLNVLSTLAEYERGLIVQLLWREKMRQSDLSNAI